MTNPDFHIWEGIQDEFPEGDYSAAWNADRWINAVAMDPLAPLARYDGRELAIHPASLTRDYPLAPVVACLAMELAPAPVRVLDFGGGGGAAVRTCLYSLPDPHTVEFHIVESERVCERGQTSFRDIPNVTFRNGMPDAAFRCDLVHTAAALHYVRDWRQLLKQMSAYGPRIILLNALNAGRIPTFVSFQNCYEHRVPVWFWNIDEMVGFVRSLGYTLAYHALLDFPFLGKIQPLPMDNFPSSHRLERKCNLMFVRDRAA